MSNSIPILVGVGQVTERDPALDAASSPLDLMEKASRLALEDAGLRGESASGLDQVVVVRSLRESHRDSPRALAERLGANRAESWLVPNGGNGPQLLVNRFAEAIAEGHSDFVLLSGSEAISSTKKILKSGARPSWPGHLDSDAKLLFPDADMTSPHERAHHMGRPAYVYSMFETALRAHYGRTIEEHQRKLGELFAPFSRAAADSPYAWHPVERSAHEIATATSANRYVGWPYTKYMNAINMINQGAALVMTSERRARELGIPRDRWLYLHGCAQASEIDPMSQRVNFYDSPAIRYMGEEAFEMAGCGVGEVDHIDLYSSFPSAVQIAADELGLAHEDPRGLSITGGLPFHGGAGNNYVMNSIAAMATRLRENPGDFGLVTANGGHLGKHAAGIYSTVPIEGAWKRSAPERIQARMDALPRATIDEHPSGPATIEAYSVAFDRDGLPERAMVMGRVASEADPEAPRFLANIEGDPDLLAAMTRHEFVGRIGRVAAGDGGNRLAIEP